MWRPRLPKKNPDFWIAAGIIAVLGVVFLIGRSAPIASAVLVGVTAVVLLAAIRR